MPWHLSKSDPRKIYDETHAVVGVMQNAGQAALIVEAVNALGPERYNTVRKESADKLNQSTEPAGAVGSESLTQTYQEDECCGKHLAKFIRSGKAANATLWPCPKCGCDWVKKSAGMFSHWTPVTVMEVIR